MTKYLDLAIEAIEIGDIESTFENLDEFEYQLEDEEEARDLLMDVKEALKHGEDAIALTYLYMMIDILTKTQNIDYTPSAEMYTIVNEMGEASRTIPKNKTEEAELELKLRRLNGKLIRVLKEDHDKRFN